jgi:PAS domain S-box-containing protein
MSLPADRNPHLQLRLDAEGLLKEGTAPRTKGWPTGTSTLGLLYKLASSPESAEDALKLLHELQVHQVELDLQHEQVEATRREIDDDLTHYKWLYEAAPVAYFSVDFAGHILEGNVAAAELFGLAVPDLSGRRIESLLAPADRPVLLGLLQELREGRSRASCDVQSAKGSATQPLRVVASAVADGAGLLVAIVPLTDRAGDERASLSVVGRPT